MLANKVRAALILLFMLAVAVSVRAATITSAKIKAHGDYVELRLGLRGPAPVWHLEPGHQRLVIELEQTRLRIGSAPAIGDQSAPITGLSAVSSAEGVVQIRIDVSGKIDYAAAITPTALIVRFAHAGEAPDIAAPVVFRLPRVRANHPHVRESERASAAAQPASSEPYAAPPRIDEIALRPPARIHQDREIAPLVVIDPGHGGRDPGTQSASGILEKEIALQIGTRLAHALESLNVRTEMTRSDDRFLTLGERTAMANRDHADLFVSIHLNSSPDRNTAGIETYYLNNTSDRATIRLARMENAAGMAYSDTSRPDLHYILTDLRQGYKANEAASLSQMVEAETIASAGSSLGLRVNALGAKTGPFYVLVGAEMPSILIECGFLSNADEARLLEDGRYQQALAEGVAAAIARYLNGEEAVGNL